MHVLTLMGIYYSISNYILRVIREMLTNKLLGILCSCKVLQKLKINCVVCVLFSALSLATLWKAYYGRDADS